MKVWEKKAKVDSGIDAAKDYFKEIIEDNKAYAANSIYEAIMKDMGELCGMISSSLRSKKEAGQALHQRLISKRG